MIPYLHIQEKVGEKVGEQGASLGRTPV